MVAVVISGIVGIWGRRQVQFHGSEQFYQLFFRTARFVLVAALVKDPSAVENERGAGEVP